MAKLLVASVAGALAMSLLAYGGSGRLGNFGHVGVDQGTLLVGVFFWFAVVGGVTVVMAGGIRPIRLRRPRRPKPARAPAADEPADFGALLAEPDMGARPHRSVPPPDCGGEPAGESVGESAEEDLPVSDDDEPAGDSAEDDRPAGDDDAPSPA